MSALRRGDPGFPSSTSERILIASAWKESAAGTATHATSACPFRELSSPGTAAYGSTEATGFENRLTLGIEVSIVVRSKRDNALSSMADSVLSRGWSPYV